VCLILISVILLQAGKGGGLTEAFGGDSSQSILGTQAPVLLKKATTVSAVAFLVTSLVLGMVTARRGKSLLAGMRIPVKVSASGNEVTPRDKVQDKMQKEKPVVPSEKTEASSAKDNAASPIADKK